MLASRSDRDLQRIVQAKWQLVGSEATSRSLKGELGLRPISYSKRERIRAHLLVAV